MVAAAAAATLNSWRFKSVPVAFWAGFGNKPLVVTQHNQQNQHPHLALQYSLDANELQPELYWELFHTPTARNLETS